MNPNNSSEPIKEVSQTTMVSFLMNRTPFGRPSHLTLHSNRLYYLKPSDEGGNVIRSFPLSKNTSTSSLDLVSLHNLSSRPLTKAEALLRERKRLPTQAILSYSFHEIDENKGKLLISSGGSIFITHIELNAQDQISVLSFSAHSSQFLF